MAYIHRGEFWKDAVKVGEKVDDLAGRGVEFADVVVFGDLLYDPLSRQLLWPGAPARVAIGWLT